MVCRNHSIHFLKSSRNEQGSESQKSSHRRWSGEPPLNKYGIAIGLGEGVGSPTVKMTDSTIENAILRKAVRASREVPEETLIERPLPSGPPKL